MARLLIDMPNVMMRSLLVGRDEENGFECVDPANADKKVWVNGWQWGYENALQLLSSAIKRFDLAPKDMVMVFEGMNPTHGRKKRAPDAGYKATRRERPERAHIEQRKLRVELEQFFLDLGAASCMQDHVEADDILAYLAQNAEEPVIVYSHDGDLTRLVGVNGKGFAVSVGNNDELNRNPYGAFPNDLITVYKALVGDSGDNIKGAHGFGDAAFLKVLQTYGVEGPQLIEQLIISRKLFELNEDLEDCKVLSKIVNDEQGVYSSYELAKLYPDDVDTKTKPLTWRYGLVRDGGPNDDQRFRQWYGTRTLVHAENFHKVLGWACKQDTDFVALDLETTTHERSDEWLAERKRRDSETGIDTLASQIVSCGMTFGDNLQHTIYLTHRHDDSDGVAQLDLQSVFTAISRLTSGRRVVAHNAGGFELPVLRRHFAFDGDWGGFLPDVHCTKILCSYIEENISSGLKGSAKHYFDYDQQTYASVTGGLKMDQLTATHTLGYGSDDPWVTAGLYNHLSFRCQAEGSWRAYCDVEQLPMYLMARAFVAGTPFSLERMRELEDEDDRAHEAAWSLLRAYLIEKGWTGTEPPSYTQEISPAEIKSAFEIVTGRPLDTMVRTPSKLVALIREREEEHAFADMLERCLCGEPNHFTEYVRLYFKGEPELNLGSPAQLASLLYATMKLPVRVRNDATDAMRAKGKSEGNAKTDELAVQMALHYDNGGERPDVLEAILTLKTIETRRKMFYVPYRHVQHWEDNMVHASFSQCATVTRRYSCSSPNLQQLPKRGEGVKFRECFVPHRRDAVVVSMDFSGQELRLMADDSQDPAMLACYVGDDLRDLHTITGSSSSKALIGRSLTYEEIEALLASNDPLGKQLRTMGKKVNFTVQYGAQAPKVAQTLFIDEDTAQKMLEARAKVFAVSEKWKELYIAQVKKQGYATTKLGARRHLREALEGSDFRAANKAERQGPNFRIQGSAAEMTKLAMASMWREKIFERFDAVPIGPIHDEFVASCALVDLPEFLRAMHACMTQPYADMTVPIESSISFGWNFGEQVEIGEHPTDAAISAGIKTLYSQRGLKHAA